MADYVYKLSINHNEKTIHDLYRTRYYTYEKIRMAARFSVGMLMIIAAVTLTLPIWARCLLLAGGAWFVASPDFPAKVTADKVVRARKEIFPKMEYEFFGDKFKISGESSMSIPYKKIIWLVHDKKYFYIFMNKDSVCMAEKESLSIQDTENFMKFIEMKTGLKWRVQKSILSMNIYDFKR